MTGSRRAIRALPYLLVLLAVAVLARGVIVSRTSTGHVVVTDHPEPTVSPTPDVPVAALRQRVPVHLIVISKVPLGDSQRRALVRATAAHALLSVSAARVVVGRGQTIALGVDPSTFRAWTPKGTAESTPVWHSVANGEAAVAHVVARAFEVPLGGQVLTQATFPLELSVGSFATTAIPGVGVVVDRERAEELGMVPDTGLLLSVPQRDAEASARLARAALPGVSVNAVQYDTQPAARGWVIPAVGRVSSGFGLRMHPIKHVVLFHDGIDIAAPLGAPVYAMCAGVVLYAGPARGFGTEVVLSHPGGVTTVYGHVSRVLVTSGPVRAGQVIALVGNEGESTGPHLHAEVRVNDQAVDPIRWLRAHGVRI